MQKLVLFALVLLGCESTLQNDRGELDAPLVKSKTQGVEIRGLDCYDTDYFGDRSFAYIIDSIDSASRRYKTDSIAHDVFSSVFCEGGLSSIYEEQPDERTEVYRLFYHPSPRSPIAVEFDFTSDNSFSARSWDYEAVAKKRPDGTTYGVQSRYENWDPVFGHLSNDQANNVRLIFDANLICEPVERYGSEGDGVARIFERLSNGRYCALIDWSKATGTRSKAILEIVGLSEFYVGE
jgi:hypothetical protein